MTGVSAPSARVTERRQLLDSGIVKGLLLRARSLGPFAFLVVLVILFTALSPRFLLLSNITTVLFTAAILTIASLAQALVMFTRNLDLSIGAVMAGAGYIPTLIYTHSHAFGPFLIPAAVVIGAAFGLINGALVAYGRIPALVATLGTLSIFRGIIYSLAQGEEIGTGLQANWMLQFVSAKVEGVPVIVIVALAFTALATLMMRQTSFGASLYAVGSNPRAAVYYGLDRERLILKAYILGGAVAGFAGLLLAAQVGTITVDIATGWELQTLAAGVIGGVSLLGGSGGMIGAAIGGLVIATVSNGLVQLGLSGSWQTLVQGVAIVFAVAFDVFLQRYLIKRRS
jgi:rhamnose transport system permease protein